MCRQRTPEIVVFPDVDEHVPDPDLSMELTEYLKMEFRRLDAVLSSETRHAMHLCQHDKVERMHTLYLLRMRCALDAADSARNMLLWFSPDVSKEKLSQDIHSVVHSDVIVGCLSNTFKKALREHVPKRRNKWLIDSVDGHICLKRLRMRTSMVFTPTRVEKIQAIVLSAASGATVLSIMGASFGSAAGATLGIVAGMPSAVLTVGLSIPSGMVMGGTCGACAGVAGGGTLGLIGGAAGGVAYAYRANLGSGVMLVANTASQMKAELREAVSPNLRAEAVDCAGRAGRAVLVLPASSSNKHVDDERTVFQALATDPTLHVTVAGAVSGAVVLGASGGGAGLVTGGVIGAACGVVPAVFTLGLSIPIGFVVGSGTGFWMGTATGGAAGAVGGGALGYTGYCAFSRKAKIFSTAKSCADFVSQSGTASAGFMKTNLFGSTGGTRESAGARKTW
jgi:hypothetical protein